MFTGKEHYLLVSITEEDIPRRQGVLSVLSQEEKFCLG